MTGSIDTEGTPRQSLFLGGARSGKSSLAERFLLNGPAPHIYVATAEAGDAEMALRIARHRADRAADWRTVEAPLLLAEALGDVPPGASVLVDCATLWLSNQLLGGADPEVECGRLVTALRTSPARRIAVVSNEVGWGIVPENALARAFRDAQGRLNQRLAGTSDLVVGVMAGLPFLLKGQAPKGLFDQAL